MTAEAEFGSLGNERILESFPVSSYHNILCFSAKGACQTVRFKFLIFLKRFLRWRFYIFWTCFYPPSKRVSVLTSQFVHQASRRSGHERKTLKFSGQ